MFDPIGSPLGTDVAGRLKEWRELYGEHITGALVTPNYAGWLDLNDRVLLNERDTAFHFAMSYRPGIDEPGSERDLGLHQLRMTEADLNRFLDNLQDSPASRSPTPPGSAGARITTSSSSCAAATATRVPIPLAAPAGTIWRSASIRAASTI